MKVYKGFDPSEEKVFILVENPHLNHATFDANKQKSMVVDFLGV